MRGPTGKAAVSLAATVAIIAAISPGSALGAQGRGEDTHYFLMSATSSGKYAVDYGNDRNQPGLTTAAGVDGTETGSWSLKIRAVGRSVGGDPLRTAAAQVKGSISRTAELYSYTVQMGELDEDPLCEGEDAVPPVKYSHPRKPKPGSGPEWIPSRETQISFGGRGFALDYPTGLSPQLDYCFHAFPIGNDGEPMLHTHINQDELPVPRGAFNPRSDRSFSGSWSDDPVDRPRDQHGDHSEKASTSLQIRVRAVSEKKATKKRDKYREEDPDPGIYRTP